MVIGKLFLPRSNTSTPLVSSAASSIHNTVHRLEELDSRYRLEVERSIHANDVQLAQRYLDLGQCA